MTQKQTERISDVYAARGYIVVARPRSLGPLEIGSITGFLPDGLLHFDGEIINQNMRVVSVTTLEDFLEQQTFMGGYGPVDPFYDKFYRVEGD